MEKVIERIAFLGGEHTFSHIAATKNFNFGAGKVELVSCQKLEQVVEFVRDKKADRGIIPFWNTSKYSILTAQEALISSKDVFITDSFKMDVHHCLISQENDLKQIKRIHTIEHVKGQCSQWVSKEMANCIFENADSTIAGVEKALKDPLSAAICSPIAASNYRSRMNLIAEKIQNDNNATLFFVISNESNLKQKNESSNCTYIAYPLNDAYKTRVEVKSITMKTLAYISTEWPLKFKDGKKWFIIEVDGHPADLGVNEFIGKLKELLPEARVLGACNQSVGEILDSEARINSY